MELKVLVDNNTVIDQYFVGEPAVCYLLTEGETKILFDLGYSSIFIDNAIKMNESLLDINYIVLSHGHNDHTGGFKPLIEYYNQSKLAFSKPVVVCHPQALAHKEYQGEDVGSGSSQKMVCQHFETNFTTEPQWLTENIVFLGEIERSNDFENTEPLGQCEHHGELIDDYVKDDSALVYKSQDGLVIITGCSHAGICNIIEYAKKVCQDERVVDVIGGFHLISPSRQQSEGTLRYFEQQQLNTIHPCHCTSLEYKIKLSRSTTVQDVGVGLTLNYI